MDSSKVNQLSLGQQMIYSSYKNKAAIPAVLDGAFHNPHPLTI